MVFKLFFYFLDEWSKQIFKIFESLMLLHVKRQLQDTDFSVHFETVDSPKLAEASVVLQIYQCCPGLCTLSASCLSLTITNYLRLS